MTPAEYATFNTLRRERNPYAHFRPFGHPKSTLAMSMERMIPIEDVARDACDRFIEAFYSFVNRRFGLGPIVKSSALEPVEPAVHPDQLPLWNDL